MNFNNAGRDLVSSLSYRISTSDDRLHAIQSLRYDCYLREGIIESKIEKIFSDEFDYMPNTLNFGIYRNEKIISAIRISILRSVNCSSPTRVAFDDIVQQWLGDGATIIDPSRFVVMQEASGRSPLSALATLRVATGAAEHFGADVVLAPVRPEHEAFYARFLGCERVCAPRPYPGISAKLALMAVRHRAVRQGIARRYPFMQTNKVQLAEMFGNAT